MANDFFRFKEFTIQQQQCAMKVGTDGVLLGSWTDTATAKNILDIGTGTGLVAIMLAQKTPAAIDAIDIDKNACIQATENVNHCQWKDNISIHHISLQEFPKITNKTYDLIVTNPPYFGNSLKTPDFQRNLARHNDTLTFEDILQGICRLLTADGHFVIILPYVESQLFIVEAAMYHLYCNKKLVIKTRPNKKPSRTLMEFGRIRKRNTENELFIYQSDNTHSAEFKNLTKMYYLNF
jgi:tRNA1Val (adenine37-N6)-methyltransferase